MDKERIDGFRSAFAPGETLFWQVPAAARERMAFYSENLPRLFSEKITAVFAVSDHYALEFMRFLQGQGIRVPEDVQIIGFDDTLASRESVPALTTIHQDAALRARTAIRRLEALRDGTPCDAGIVLPVELVERESTRRLPSSVWGAGYFRIVAFSYLPMAVSTVLSAWLRCKEHAAVPFWASFGAVAANIGLELSAHLRKAGCPRYGRYRCCHRHAGFPAFEPAFDLDRLCGLPSKGSGTPAHRGDLDTVGGRFMFIFRVQRRA